MSYTDEDVKEWQKEHLIKNPMKGSKLALGVMSTREFNSLLVKFLNKEKKLFKEEVEAGDHNGVFPKVILALIREPKKKERPVQVCLLGNAQDIFSDSGMKKRAFGAMGIKMAKENLKIAAAYLVSEVWVGSADERDAKGNILRPSEQKNKSEAVMVSGMTIDGRVNMATCVIGKVGKDKTIPMLGEENIIKYNKKEGVDMQSYILQTFYDTYTPMVTLNEKLKDAPPALKEKMEALIKAKVGGTFEQIDMDKGVDKNDKK